MAASEPDQARCRFGARIARHTFLSDKPTLADSLHECDGPPSTLGLTGRTRLLHATRYRIGRHFIWVPVPALGDILENASGIEGRKGTSSEAQRLALIIPPHAAAAADVKGSYSESSRCSAQSPRRITRIPTRIPRWTGILRLTLSYALVSASRPASSPLVAICLSSCTYRSFSRRVYHKRSLVSPGSRWFSSLVPFLNPELGYDVPIIHVNAVDQGKGVF